MTADRFIPKRIAGVWHVIDTLERHPDTVAGAGAAGARLAGELAAQLNSRPASGRGRAKTHPAPASMSREDLRAWRQRNGLTLAELADYLGVHWITVQRWESGRIGVPPYLYLALREVERQHLATSSPDVL